VPPPRRTRTSKCVVQAGVLDDPYTGTRIEFTKAQADDVQIDHVVPLAYAWDMGAWTWNLEQRKAFANDESLNLLAVAKAANVAKRDRGPATWTPSNSGYRCQYAIRWVAVLSAYDLQRSAGGPRRPSRHVPAGTFLREAQAEQACSVGLHDDATSTC
jgi:hypothetical protein